MAIDHQDMQDAARQAMDITRAALRPGRSLQQIRDFCESLLLDLGAESFWYWDIGAFVFAGETTTVSVSGRAYRTPHHVIGENDIITLDLSPQRDGVWGDYARTIIVEDGVALEDARTARNDEWREGVLAEHSLHDHLHEVAAPDMSFEQLAEAMNARIRRLGFENLDFLGNLGHSIESRSADRVYIEPGNGARLDSVRLFTFEPHIRRPGGRFGYKHENIYHFADGRLREL